MNTYLSEIWLANKTQCEIILILKIITGKTSDNNKTVIFINSDLIQNILKNISTHLKPVYKTQMGNCSYLLC